MTRVKYSLSRSTRSSSLVFWRVRSTHSIRWKKRLKRWASIFWLRLNADWIFQKEYPLSEKLLALSRVWRSPNGRDYVIAAKGAPEAIADLCHLSAGHQTALERHISALAVMRRVTTALIVGASSYFYPIPIRDFSISHSRALRMCSARLIAFWNEAAGMLSFI